MAMATPPPDLTRSPSWSTSSVTRSRRMFLGSPSDDGSRRKGTPPPDLDPIAELERIIRRRMFLGLTQRRWLSAKRTAAHLALSALGMLAAKSPYNRSGKEKLSQSGVESRPRTVVKT